MKKVTSRASAALVLAGLVIAGLVFYLVRLVRDGGDWASFYANDTVYADGVLNAGTITDRNNLILAEAGNGTYSYADSQLLRVANLHVVGDVDGNIGTGALSVFREDLIHYSLLSGTSGRSGTVQLSVDAELNATAYEALDGRAGAVLVYNYETGEILCMTSSPSFDPLTGIDESDSAYEGAYINRGISAALTPGSIFKIVTLAAAIETDPDLFEESFYCDGSLTIGSDVVTCTGCHGWQTVGEAFANSCNCAFAQIAMSLGGDTIQAYADSYGLTSEHELNGILTKAGSVTSGGGENANTAWEGIGQYEDLVCPYAMLRLVGAIANGGVCTEPTLLCGGTTSTVRLVRESTADTLADMMNYNAVYDYGSDWRFPGLDISAKTGTAETGRGTSHAWFAGFVENAGCPYAFVVVIEDAGSGLDNAGTVANAVLQQAVFG